MMRARWVLFAATLSLPGAALAWDPPTLPGFKGPAEVERFDGKTVWQAIDGAAELYVAYGFKQLTSVEYERKDLTLAVGVFEQATALDAYGVFLKQRQKDATLLSIGTVALAAAPVQCVVVKGAFYVKADAVRGAVTPETCGKILPVFAKALPGDTTVPHELARLPKKGQVDGSLGYTKTSYLGLSDLKNVVHARYDDGGKRYQLFQLLGDLEGLSAKWTTPPNVPGHVRVRAVPYQGDVVVASFPKGTFGILGAKDVAQALAVLKTVAD